MVDIIPKPKTTSPWWTNLAIFISISLLLASIVTYFFLNSLINRVNSEITKVEQELNAEPESEIKEKEAYILKNKTLIDNFSLIFSGRPTMLGAFALIEKVSHPEVWFRTASFSPVESKIFLSGEASSFEALGEQYLVLQQEPLIESVNLSGIEMEKNGRVGFSFDLICDSKLFK